jgi:hypothetical protein
MTPGIEESQVFRYGYAAPYLGQFCIVLDHGSHPQSRVSALQASVQSGMILRHTAIQ